MYVNSFYHQDNMALTADDPWRTVRMSKGLHACNYDRDKQHDAKAGGQCHRSFVSHTYVDYLWSIFDLLANTSSTANRYYLDANLILELSLDNRCKTLIFYDQAPYCP